MIPVLKVIVVYYAKNATFRKIGLSLDLKIVKNVVRNLLFGLNYLLFIFFS